ncbi:voltage-gated calcium channel, putative, partial [Ixodes scapularis]
WFERVSMLVILLNCVTLGMYQPCADNECQSARCRLLQVFDDLIFAFFALEMCIKVLAMGFMGKNAYLAEAWNRLDFFIVVAGALEYVLDVGNINLSAIRTIRVLRPLRAINRIPSMRILVMLLLDTLPMLGNVLLLCFFVFFIFGIVGVQLWAGLLRQRCYLVLPDDNTVPGSGCSPISSYYQGVDAERDFICSTEKDNGMHRCSGLPPLVLTTGLVCNASALPHSDNVPTNASCVNWNQYYSNCTAGDKNPFQGSISFDNIGLAWVAIFLVISLEGWSDIMYYVQDAHSFWDWIYFVLLIVIGSFFMINLCLVVIATQFSETKKREMERMRMERARYHSSSTLASTSVSDSGCYTQIINAAFSPRFLRWYRRRKRRRARRAIAQATPAAVEATAGSPISLRHQPSTPRRPTPPRTGDIHHSDRSESQSSGTKHYSAPQLTFHSHGSSRRRRRHPQPVDSPPSTSPSSSSSTSSSCSGAHSDSSSCGEEEDDGEEGRARGPCCRFWRARQVQLRRLVGHQYFQRGILTAILVNTLSMGIEYHDQPHELTQAVEISNLIFTGIFGLEMLLKILAEGFLSYISSGFNLFDGVIVILSIVELTQSSGSGLSVLRTFRLLRILKLVRFMPALRRQLFIMLRTMDNVAVFFALLILFIFIFSVLGMNLFGCKFCVKEPDGTVQCDRKNFDSLLWALVTVFQILTQEDWNVVLFNGMEKTSPWAALYFVALMTFGNYVLFNLLVAILVEGFSAEALKDTADIDADGNQKYASQDAEDDPKDNIMKGIVFSPCGSHNTTARANVRDNQYPRAVINERQGHHRDAAVVPVQKRGCCPSRHADARRTRRRSRPWRSPAFPRSSHTRRPPRRALPAPPWRCPWFEISATGSRPSRRCTFPRPVPPHPRPTPGVAPRSVPRSCLAGAKQQTLEDDKREQAVHNAFVIRSITKWCFENRDNHSLFIFPPESKMRIYCNRLTDGRWFDYTVLVFIALNCITLAMERPNIPPKSLERELLIAANYTFTVVFAFEMLVKVIAKGLWYGDKAYFKSGWNKMDGVLVTISLVDFFLTFVADGSPRIFGILRVFRLLRSLRPLRVINRAPGLKLVVQTLMSSLRPIGNIVLICCTFFIIFGILGVQLFKGSFYFCEGPDVKGVRTKEDCLERGMMWTNRKYNFDHLGQALMALFVLSSKDGWVNIMYSGLDAVGEGIQPVENYNEWRLLYFISFLLLVAFFVLNMFVGVVVENFHRCREEQEREERAMRAAKRARKLEKKRRSEFLCLAEMREPPYYANYSKPRLFTHNIVTSKYFDLAIAAVIGLNVVTMAMEFYRMPLELEYALKIFNYFFTAVSFLILKNRCHYFSFGSYSNLILRWNQLDILIVILSIMGIVLEEMKSDLIPINPTIIRVMRVLRIARVLKLLKMAKGIRALLDTVMQALPQVGNLGLLFFLLFFIFAALGLQKFPQCDESHPCQGLGEHAHFHNFGMAFLTLFRVATGDNWNGIMKDTLRDECDARSDCVRNCCVSAIIAPLYFVVFVLMAQFVLVNVVVAVLMKHLEESHKQ